MSVCNREQLIALLRETGETVVELYGVWDGNFATPPAIREEVSAEAVLEDGVRFKEQGFYVVTFKAAPQRLEDREAGTSLLECRLVELVDSKQPPAA